MKIKDINLRKIDKEVLISNLLEKSVETPSKMELKEIQNIIAESIDEGVYLKARNALIIAIFYDCDTTISYIRKKGLFRYSKYTSKKCMIPSLAYDIIEVIIRFNYASESRITYLQSIINFAPVLDSYNENDKHIRSEIKVFENKYRNKSLVKTLLSYIDLLFLSNHVPQLTADLAKTSSWSKEDLCSAVSYIIFYYTERIKRSKEDTNFIAEEFIKSGNIDRILIPACFISDYKEFEIMIDHFQYRCIKTGKRVIIEPLSEDFEKSIRLGYIRTELQNYNDRFNADGVASIEQIVEDIYKIDGLKFFEFTDNNNYPRYRFKTYENIYDEIINKILKPDSLFKEELMYLAQVFKEQLLNPKDLKKIQIRDKFSLFEFLKIRRVFVFIYLLFSKEIYQNEKVEYELVLRSLIPTFTRDAFIKFLKKLEPTARIESFLDVVCWKPGLNMLFDLQYHAIICLNNNYLIPLSIFANSNYIRNLFASEYKKDNKGLLSDGTIDPLAEALHSSFSEAKIKSYKQTPIYKSEIDLFAVYENTLFIFECKHTLHPVSSFDLRTTFDYIKKAENQLDYIKEENAKGNLLSHLEKKHDIDLSNINNIQFCIVLSNRLFNGNVFKYPIRNINEIDNILNRGTMRTEEGEFWLWQNNQLTSHDLIEYFSLENKLVQLLYNSLSKRTLTYNSGTLQVIFDSYYMDFIVATEKLNEFTSKLRKYKENNKFIDA